MTDRITLLLLSILVSGWLPVAIAQQADSASSAEISGDDYLDDSEAVSRKLEAFIKGAVESGLLQTDTPQEPSEAAVAAQTLLQCKGLDALDFKDFTLLETYPELIEFRRLLTASTTVKREDADLLLIKAYISLGLEAEARLKLRALDTKGGRVLIELIDLIEGKPAALIERLKDTATCSPEARFWYGVAVLEENSEQGSDLINQGMVVFRTLPFQVQANVASRIVPILERMGNKLLAQKIMASFTAEQIRSSSKLQFNQAVLDMSLGHQFDMRLVESFLEKPSASDVAMRAVLSQDQQPYLINEITRVSDAVHFIHQANSKLDQATRLHVVTRAYIEAGRFEDIRRLSTEPLLTGQSFQDAMAHSLIDYVSSGLSNPSVQRKVSAINFLLKDTGLLLDDASGRKLMQDAVSVARDNGFHILAGLLLEKLDNQIEALPDQIEYAYRRQDYAKVYAMAEAHADRLDLLHFAALSAIDEADKARLGTYEIALRADPERLIDVMEADVLSGQWLLSEDSISALKVSFADEQASAALSQRFERALLIRERGQAAEAPRVPDFADVSDLLAANKAGLGAISEGTGS